MTRPARRSAALAVVVAALAALASAAPAARAADTVDRELANARRLMNRGRSAEAVLIYEQVLRKNPNEAHALADYGAALITLQRLPDAEQALEKAVALAPENERAWLGLERVRRLEGRDREALADAVSIVTRFPGQIEWALTEIRDIVQKPDLVPVALAELRAAIARESGRADLRGLASEIAFEAGQYEEAIAEARAADEASTGNGEILFRLAGRARAAGKGETARTIAEELRQKHPAAPYRAQLLLLLGTMYQEGKRPQEALAAYHEAAAAAAGSPDAARAHILAGRLHQSELRDPAAALAEYAKVDAAALSPEDRAALLALQADGYLSQGDFAKAASTVDELALAGPSDAAREHAAFERAEILFFQGRFDEASAEYRALAQSFASGDFVNDAIERIFLIQENSGAGEDAMRAFGRAEYQARIGDDVNAIAGLRALLAEGAGAQIADDARFRLATILIASGRKAEGASELHSLAVDIPASKYAPRALRLAGDALRDLGRPGDALGEYQILFNLYPHSLDADEVRPVAEELRRKAGS